MVIDIVDDGVHPGLPDGKYVPVVRGTPEHPQKSVFCEGVALGGNRKPHRGGGIPGLSIETFNALLLLQKGNGITEKFLALLGEFHTPVAADKKLDAQFLLQLPDGSGNAGLREKKLLQRLC